MRVPERDTRIAELEARLRSPRRAGVRFPVAVVCCLGALYLLYRELPDAAYALSAPTVWLYRKLFRRRTRGAPTPA